jgi:hypothetical protein
LRRLRARSFSLRSASAATRSRRPGFAVWRRLGRETSKKRLKTLEVNVTQDGLVLTESKLVAREQAKTE